MVGCSQKQTDNRIAEFEKMLGNEPTKSVNSLVSDFEENLDKIYPDLSTEKAYRKYLKEMISGQDIDNMKNEWLKWIGMGLILVPLNAIFHELGHYAMYHIYDADNIVLHYASVSANTDNLSITQKAITAISGPLISYVFLILAIVFLTKHKSIAWMILGFVTTLRGLVNLPYLIANLKGYGPSPNFDEYNFSIYMDIDPIIVSGLTLTMILFAIIYFSILAFKQKRFIGIGLLWTSVVLGLIFWGTLGKFLLP